MERLLLAQDDLAFDDEHDVDQFDGQVGGVEVGECDFGVESLESEAYVGLLFGVGVDVGFDFDGLVFCAHGGLLKKCVRRSGGWGSPSAGTAIGAGGEECQGQAVTVTGTVTFLPPAVAVMVTGLPVSVALLPVTVTVLPLTVAVAFAVSPLVAVMVQPVAFAGETVTLNVSVRP
ncbi:hypothetical protein HMPREF1587_01991, partial [Bifidobacterium breve JCP7499]